MRYLNPLHQVVTIDEAAEIWCYSTYTIRNHLNAGRIKAERAGWKWLIPVYVLRELYGDPPGGDAAILRVLSFRKKAS